MHVPAFETAQIDSQQPQNESTNKLIRNEAEAIDCLRKNRPTSGFYMLQESVDMAIKALEDVQLYRNTQVFSKTATISTAHIKPETADLLNVATTTAFKLYGVSVYSKEDVGYYIYPIWTLIEEEDALPQDLKDCLEFMKKYNCTCLCLDRDGEILNELPDYSEDWQRGEYPSL